MPPVSPLSLAAFFGHTDIVQLLVCRGAEVNSTTEVGIASSLHHYIIIYIHVACTSYCLHIGLGKSRVLVGDIPPLQNVYSPLTCAIVGRQPRVVEFLLKQNDLDCSLKGVRSTCIIIQQNITDPTSSACK